MVPSLRASDQVFLNNLNRVQKRMAEAQARITTGLKVERPSDAPDQVSTLLATRSTLARTEQIQSNLGRVKAEVDAGEQALQNAVSLFERARTLGAQGVTGTQTASTRHVTAQEIGAIMEQLTSLAATQVEGRYIFSGDLDRQAPYSVNLTQTNPMSAFQGSASTRAIQHPNGTTFQAALTANEIFDSSATGSNVFGALNALRTSLLNNDEAAVRQAVDGMIPAGDHLNRQLAMYGTFQNRMQAASNFGSDLTLQLHTQIGTIQDADLTEAILEIKQGEIQLNAALTSRAQLPRQTLFDFIR
jgi:flagellar hook-associated protein 3 FlgL